MVSISMLNGSLVKTNKSSLNKSVDNNLKFCSRDAFVKQSADQPSFKASLESSNLLDKDYLKEIFDDPFYIKTESLEKIISSGDLLKITEKAILTYQKYNVDGDSKLKKEFDYYDTILSAVLQSNKNPYKDDFKKGTKNALYVENTPYTIEALEQSLNKVRDMLENKPNMNLYGKEYAINLLDHYGNTLDDVAVLKPYLTDAYTGKHNLAHDAAEAIPKIVYRILRTNRGSISEDKLPELVAELKDYRNNSNNKKLKGLISEGIEAIQRVSCN